MTTTSTISLPMFSLSDLESGSPIAVHMSNANTVYDFPFIRQRSNTQLSYDTRPRTSICPHNLAGTSSFQSNLYANDKPSQGAQVSDQNVGGEKKQPSSSFKTNHPSSSFTKTDHVRTTTHSILESSPHSLLSCQEQLPRSTDYGYFNVNSATSKYSRVNNQTHVDNSSLLLLANCATFTAAEADSMQSRPLTSMSEQSISSIALTLMSKSESSGTQLPFSPLARECEATHLFPAATSTYSQSWYCHGQHFCVKGESQQYSQSIIDLHDSSRSLPRKQLSLITEKEMQDSCLSYLMENIQAPQYSEEPFPLQDILDNQESELQVTDTIYRSKIPNH